MVFVLVSAVTVMFSVAPAVVVEGKPLKRRLEARSIRSSKDSNLGMHLRKRGLRLGRLGWERRKSALIQCRLFRNIFILSLYWRVARNFTNLPHEFDRAKRQGLLPIKHERKMRDACGSGKLDLTCFRIESSKTVSVAEFRHPVVAMRRLTANGTSGKILFSHRLPN